MTATRSFSIGLYLVIVFAFSWPFQLAFIVFGDRFRPILPVSMIMAGVGTFVAGRFVFGDGFDDAGWRWGRPRYYILAFGLALFLWLVPFIVTMGFALGGAPAVSTPLVLGISLVPTVLHAVVFAYLWSISGSLLVATVYHSAFDEVRDTLQESVGFGTLAEKSRRSRSTGRC